MNKDIIKVLKDSIIFNQKNLIIDFLEKEDCFYSIINNNDKEKMLSDNFVLLGRELNNIRSQIKYNENEFETLNEYLSYLGLRAILSLKYIPQNYHYHLSKQEFSGISCNSLSKIFNILYKKYSLINTIYDKNGDLGITKYILINKKIIEYKDTSLGDLYVFKFLDMEDIINITSNSSDINKYKSNEILYKICKTKLVEKRKIYKKDNNIINL